MSERGVTINLLSSSIVISILRLILRAETRFNGTDMNCILVIALTVFLAVPLQSTVQAAAASTESVAASVVSGGQKHVQVKPGDKSYENTTINEDVNWSGSVHIRGFLVISPQATVRIDPGTIVRFSNSPIINQKPRMVVMGRLHCNGTQEKPVLITSSRNTAAKGEWGGILFLSTEKKNQLDHVRIEAADIAIEGHSSNLIINNAMISKSGIGLLLYDCFANLGRLKISQTETALQLHNSEVELKNATLAENGMGITATASSLAATAVRLHQNSRYGMLLDDCRIRISSADFTDNALGVIIIGGEGQLFRSRFIRNRGLALELAGARLKVNNTVFADNMSDSVTVLDRRSILYENSFSGNSGFNLVNRGSEQVIAVQNWWGSSEEKQILKKISNQVGSSGSGRVVISPWLYEKPSRLNGEM
jgi:hypothetical protein